MSLLNIMRQPCVYFGRSKSQGNDTKIGKSSILNNRKTCLDTSYSRKGFEFEKLILCETSEQESEIEDYLHIEYDNDSTVYLADHNGGEEWFNKQFATDEVQQKLIEGGYTNKVIDNPEIIKKAFEEYKQIYESNPEKHRKKIQELKQKRDRNKRSRQWFERQYQTDIIKLGLDKLNELGKFYLELATGAGKTYIVFNILKNINPDIIFCLSPRLKINSQNISKKYKSILGDEYETFNLSHDKNFDEFIRKPGKKIIAGCITNHRRVYDIINEYNIDNSCIWFDEAHWGIEGWIDKGLNEVQDFLLNSDNIKYRIYTSASPNVEKVENNERIFGELFKEITVKQLIELKYLCNIKPFIFEVQEYNVNYCKTILEDFKNYNRTWGLSFHTSCINAFNMFLKHYKDYKNQDTLIKPYLLVGESKEIKSDRRTGNIDLDYNYECFKSYERSENSIAYVVKKCDMGYDFENIDYISLTDKKMSYSDLIQCIGRGLRSDKNGDNGKNKDKELYLMIPNYIDEDNSDNFDNIINVIQFLQNDIGLEWEDIPYEESNSGSSRSANGSEDYDGEKVVKSKLMDAMRLRTVEWTTKKLVVYCKNNNIHSNEEYRYFKEKHISLNLPVDLPNDFNWCKTYRKHNYYSKDECIEKIKDIMEVQEDLELMEDHEDLLEILNNIDKKIPNNCLWSFYGGNQSEYLVFN
jgi:superfamily II DNA or RNA helicase